MAGLWTTLELGFSDAPWLVTPLSVLAALIVVCGILILRAVVVRDLGKIVDAILESPEPQSADDDGTMVQANGQHSDLADTWLRHTRTHSTEPNNEVTNVTFCADVTNIR